VLKNKNDYCNNGFSQAVVPLKPPNKHAVKDDPPQNGGSLLLGQQGLLLGSQWVFLVFCKPAIKALS
jgi:hypothetical protein